MRALVVSLVALAAAGCDPGYTYSGYNMDDYFPFDGQRTWEYVSTDTSLSYKLVATLEAETEQGGDGVTIIHDVRYDYVCVGQDTTCTDEWVRTVRWSSNRTYGTRIHGFETPLGMVTYDPPVQVTEGQMIAGESVDTDSGGTTWTGTFVGLDTCPVDWTSEWGNRCAHITLDDGDGDDTVGEYLAGDYWAITQYNVVGMRLTEDTGTWRLVYATYEYE